MHQEGRMRWRETSLAIVRVVNAYTAYSRILLPFSFEVSQRAFCTLLFCRQKTVKTRLFEACVVTENTDKENIFYFS